MFAAEDKPEKHDPGKNPMNESEKELAAELEDGLEVSGEIKVTEENTSTAAATEGKQVYIGLGEVRGLPFGLAICSSFLTPHV